MTTRFTLARELERLRMSQTELANRSGLSIRTVNRLQLNRTSQVALSTLDAIATVLKVEPGRLVGRDKPEPAASAPKAKTGSRSKSKAKPKAKPKGKRKRN